MVLELKIFKRMLVLPIIYDFWENHENCFN